jgi:hypothetical protein
MPWGRTLVRPLDSSTEFAIRRDWGVSYANWPKSNWQSAPHDTLGKPVRASPNDFKRLR